MQRCKILNCRSFVTRRWKWVPNFLEGKVGEASAPRLLFSSTRNTSWGRGVSYEKMVRSSHLPKWVSGTPRRAVLQELSRPLSRKFPFFKFLKFEKYDSIPFDKRRVRYFSVAIWSIRKSPRREISELPQGIKEPVRTRYALRKEMRRLSGL